MLGCGHPSSMRWLALLLVVSLLVPATGCIRDFEDRERHNRVDLRSIDVAAPSVTTGTVDLAVNATLDNRGSESDETRLRVKAFDTQTGFLEETKETANRTLTEDTTVTVGVLLELPRRAGYRIEIEVFEGGRIVDSGHVTVRNLASLEPTIQETSVSISEMEFMVRNVSRDRVRIETQLYLTNEGAGDSGPLRLQVKARDVETGLLADELWTDLGPIPPQQTRIESVELDVPDEHNYAVEAALWDDNLTVEKGQGTVELAPTSIRNASETIEVKDPSVEDFLREEQDRDRERGQGDRGAEAQTQETPALGAAVLAVLAAAAVAWRWRNER